jgi:hypothetical protein
MDQSHRVNQIGARPKKVVKFFIRLNIDFPVCRNHTGDDAFVKKGKSSKPYYKNGRLDMDIPDENI